MPTKDEMIDDALALANKVEALVRGKDRQTVTMALGWIIGAGAYHPGADQRCLETALTDIRNQAQVKFKGMLDGSWR